MLAAVDVVVRVGREWVGLCMRVKEKGCGGLAVLVAAVVDVSPRRRRVLKLWAMALEAKCRTMQVKLGFRTSWCHKSRRRLYPV